jgi:smad nuclear-interacting protein 1
MSRDNRDSRHDVSRLGDKRGGQYDDGYRSRSNERYQRYQRYPTNDRQIQGRAQGTAPRDGPRDGPPIVKEKPNFKPSGLLAKESNSVNGVALKYVAPQDGRTPPESPTYHLYSFKEGAKIPKIYELTKGYYLIGRDEKVVDIKTDDETCSKQHAVIQFRERSVVNSEGHKTTEITYVSIFMIFIVQLRQKKEIYIYTNSCTYRPYIIDLESSNGTLLNDDEIPTSRFIELKSEDVLRFGDSTTDNVLIVS